MGTIFQIVSSALCYFSHHNYLPVLSYEMQEVSFHCAGHCKKQESIVPGAVGPSTHWILRYSLLHCRTQPPSFRNTQPLSPDGVVTERTVEVWVMFGELQKFRNLQKFSIWKACAQAAIISVDNAYVFKLTESV